MGFQEKPLEKADFIFKLTVPAMVRPASSDKWKAPLDSNVARKKERWKKKIAFSLLLCCPCFMALPL